jgi:hypothetical protein
MRKPKKEKNQCQQWEEVMYLAVRSSTLVVCGYIIIYSIV